jgi:hypothetical protein
VEILQYQDDLKINNLAGLWTVDRQQPDRNGSPPSERDRGALPSIGTELRFISRQVVLACPENRQIVSSA